MKFLVAQVAGRSDAADAIGDLEGAVNRAVSEGADLVVLPEYASGFDPAGVGAAQAQGIDGPYVERMRALARAHHLWVVAGVTLWSDHGPLPVNTVVVVDPTGTIAGRYDKVHLYDAFGARESDRLAPGDPAAAATVVTIAGVRVGVITCYDLRFPESVRRVIDGGAELVLIPAAWASGPGKASQWEILARARAIENVAVVAAVGLTGAGVTGESRIIGPDGAIRGQLGADPGYVVGTVFADEFAAARSHNPSLAARRYRVVPN